MEDDKVAFLEEFALTLNRQTKIIQVLQKEKEALKEDMVVVNCVNQSRNDEKIVFRINRLLEEFTKCRYAMKTEKEGLKELEVQIRKVS